MDIALYILCGILFLLIIVMVAMIFTNTKPIKQVDMHNCPAGKRVLEETLAEKEIITLLKDHYNKKN